MNKNILTSKTFYFGLITAIAPLFPVVGEFIKTHTSEITMIWGSLAMILRYVTKDKVVLLP